MNLTVELAAGKRSLTLANPVMTASGTFSYGLEYQKIFDVQRLGAVGVGAMAYRAGMMQGWVTSGQVVAPNGTGPTTWWHSGPMMFGGRGHMGWG